MSGQTAGSREVEVRARVTGILLSRNFKEGQRVTKGQSLFTIDPKPFEAALARAVADVAAAEARLEQAKRNAARLKPLYAEKAVSQKEHDDAVSAEQIGAADVAAAQARLTEARLNLEYTKVEAPVSGISTRAVPSEGTLVSGPSVLLTSVVQVDPIWVNFGIPDNERARLQKEVEAGRLTLPKNGNVEVALRLADGSMYPHTGRLNFSDVRISTATGSQEARAELPNKEGDCCAPASSCAWCCAAPRARTRSRCRSARCWKGRRASSSTWSNDKSAAEPRPVEVGDWAGDTWIITSGLKGGEQVIVDGVMKIGPGRAGEGGREAGACKKPKQPGEEVMFSRFFIDRPIFAAVLSIFIILAGLAAMRVLPIAQYPEISPPVVTVTAIYPGASAPVLESTVAAPLENAINGVEDMLYMNSTSSANGMVQIQVTFNIGTDIDKATLNVNNRAKQVEPRLPLEVRRQGVTVEKGSSAFLQVLAFYSPDGRHDDIFISNYVTLNVLDEIKRVPGTTLVQIFGAKDYAMRIWLRPDRLATLKLAPGDVIRALNEQNAQFAAGKVGEAPTAGPQELVYSVTTKGRLSEPKEFEDIILRANGDGSLLRLKDVARVELAGKDYSFNGTYNGRPATLMGIFLQPGANQLEVGEAVRTRLNELAAALPGGLHLCDPVRHHHVRRGVDPRSGDHAARGDAAGVPGGVHLPAELARDADPVRRGAGVADRHLRRPAAARLLDQHADLVRHGARHRHRGRRRHRGAGERRAHHDARRASSRATPRSRRCARSPARSSPSCSCCARCSSRSPSSAASPASSTASSR